MLRAGVLVCGKKVLPKDMKLPYEKEPPAMYCMECSLPKDITKKLRVVMCEDEDSGVLGRCNLCGFHNVKPTKTCKILEKTVMCTCLSQQEVVLQVREERGFRTKVRRGHAVISGVIAEAASNIVRLAVAHVDQAVDRTLAHI